MGSNADPTTTSEQQAEYNQRQAETSPASLSETGAVGRLFDGPSKAAGASPSDTTKFLSHQALSLSANSSVRGVALRQVQRTYGNSFVQGAIAARQTQANGDGPVLASGNGERLAEGTRALMESRLGADLDDVRIHTDSQAAASAEGLNANAFTTGRDIYFGNGQYSPGTASGQRLIAHELTHTMQQREGRSPTLMSADSRNELQMGSPEDPLEHEADAVAQAVVSGSSATAGSTRSTPQQSTAPSYTGSIQRQPKGRFPGDEPVSDAPAFVDSATIVDPGKTDHEVMLLAPVLTDPRRASETDRIRIMVHTDVFKREDITLYAVPITSVHVPAAAPAPATTTTTTTTKVGTAAVTPPAIAPGSVVTAADGVKLDVIAATPEHVITSKYTKFAVGAASTSALRLMDGTVIVIDAGINNRGLGTKYTALADATMQKLADFIKNDPIREILISHVHKDHVSLVLEIMRKFRVDTIRINDVMKRWPGYRQLRKEIVKIQEQRLKQTEAALKQEIALERTEWEKANEHPDKGIMQERWEEHAAKELKKRMAETPRLKERTLVPSKGHVQDVVNVDVATGEKTSPADEFTAEDPLEIRETMKDPTDPNTLDRRRNTDKKDVDPFASAYLIALPNGMRFLVMPDIRASDMEALTKRFLDEYNKLKLKQPVTVQVWDATHHMQVGWKGDGIPATQFRKIVDFLAQFQTKQGADAVVVSAQADLSRPGAKTLVDPANIWLLRSLGFEVFLATSGRDVTFFEITTTQGTKLAGTAAPKAIGPTPGELSIKRAKMALDKLNADKQTQEVLRADEKDVAKQKEIDAAISEIDSRIKQIDTALNDYIKAGHEALAKQKPAGGHTTQTLGQLTEPALNERKALDALLEKWNFDRPLTTDLQLTEMAMVVLRQEVNLTNAEPGSPAARALDLKRTRSRINELGAQIARGGAPDQVTADLFVELQKYKSILISELNPIDPNQKALPEGVTKTLLQDDLKSVEQKIEQLEGAKKSSSLERAIGSGEIIETHVVAVQKPAQESTAMRATRGAADVAGRGLGAVMVIQTVRGQGNLMKRWEEGRANNAEMVFDTAHNLGATVAGVKMIQGIHVSNGVFVVLSLLDVGAAIARDYDTEEQRNVEVSYALISNALNLGLMVVGQALMRIPNPVTFIAGFLISFAGPLILDALGVHEWLERKYGFNPSDVIQVYQTLRKLLNEYSIIAGSIMLADRTAQGLEDIAASDSTALREQARITARDHRIKALPLEREILGEFKTAYDDAKGNYAGLKELDQYREEFIVLQKQANPHGEEIAAWQEVYGAERAQMREQTAKAQKEWDKHPQGGGIPPSTNLAFAELSNPEPQPTQELMRKTFANIESRMSLDNMTAEEIRDMPQWSKLNDALKDLIEAVSASSSEMDHEKIRKKYKEARLMIENARYRLNPRRQADFRSQGLFSPNSPARAIYAAELEVYERWFALAQEKYIETAMRLCGAPLLTTAAGETHLGAEWRLVLNKLTPETMVQMVEVAVNRYKATVGVMFAPPEELIVAMFTNSADAQTYEKFIEDKPFYGEQLKQLENTRNAINGLIDQAWAITRPEATKEEESPQVKRLKEAVAQMKSAEEIRFHKRGIIFPSEIKGLAAQVKESDVSELARLLGEKPDTQQLKQEEVAALETSQMESIKEGIVPPISNRLRLIPELRRSDANGSLTNIFQLYGNVAIYSKGKWIQTVKSVFVRNEDKVVVGRIGEGEDYQPSADSPALKTARVIPLNTAAVKLFEGFMYIDVLRSNLEPLNIKQLEAMKPK